MTRFTDLPQDSVFLICEHLEHERGFNSLVRTSRALYRVLNGCLYHNHVRFHRSWALTWAAEHDMADTAKWLLAAGADEADLPPPIVVAARHNSLAMLKLLCETEGVDPDWEDEDTSPAMVWAAEMGFEEMTWYLLAEPMVDPQLADQDGWTTLSYAAEHGQEATVKMFVRDP